MKLKSIKSFFAVLYIGLSALLLVSCVDNSDPKIGTGIEPVILNTEYDLNEDIVIDIYIGICSEHCEFPTNHKYQIAITNNMKDSFGYGDDLIVLQEITSNPDGKYNYKTDKHGEAIYTYFEKFTLPYEIFSDVSGFFYLGLLEINIKSERIGGMMVGKYSYVVKSSKVTITHAR